MVAPGSTFKFPKEWIHWGTVIKHVSKSEGGISILDLADKMSTKEKPIPRFCPHLDKAVASAIVAGKIRIVLGMSSDGIPCRFLISNEPHENARTRLDQEDKEVDKKEINIESQWDRESYYG